MRYRKLTEDGSYDYTWGHGLRDYHHDSVEGVAQAIRTRLLLFVGEFYLDTSAGMPWGGFPISQNALSEGRVLDRTTQPDRDFAIQMCILDTQGVLSVIDYASDFDGNPRRFTASATVNTIYGQIDVTVPSPAPWNLGFGLTLSPLGGSAPL